jgi:hypothetical protein
MKKTIILMWNPYFSSYKMELEDIWARYTQKLHDEGSIDGERAAHMAWGDIL